MTSSSEKRIQFFFGLLETEMTSSFRKPTTTASSMTTFAAENYSRNPAPQPYSPSPPSLRLANSITSASHDSTRSALFHSTRRHDRRRLPQRRAHAPLRVEGSCFLFPHPLLLTSQSAQSVVKLVVRQVALRNIVCALFQAQTLRLHRQLKDRLHCILPSKIWNSWYRISCTASS